MLLARVTALALERAAPSPSAWFRARVALLILVVPPPAKIAPPEARAVLLLTVVLITVEVPLVWMPPLAVAPAATRIPPPPSVALPAELPVTALLASVIVPARW
jgi:hypothetical protein